MVSPAGALPTQSAHPISLTHFSSFFHSPYIIIFFFTPSSPPILVLACPILSHCTSLSRTLTYRTLLYLFLALLPRSA